MQEWFRHDLDAPGDPKLTKLRLRCGYEGVGVYWTLLAILARVDLRMWPDIDAVGLADTLRIKPKRLDKIMQDMVEVGLLVHEKGFYYSHGLLKRMEKFDEQRAVLSMSGSTGGKKSAQIRAERRIIQANAQAGLKPALSQPQAPLKPGSSKFEADKSRVIKEKEEEKEKLSGGQGNGFPDSEQIWGSLEPNPAEKLLTQKPKKNQDQIRVPRTSKSIADLMPAREKAIESDLLDEDLY